MLRFNIICSMKVRWQNAKIRLIEKILEENNGILRLEDALLAGISKTYALDFIKKSNYEQVARGDLFVSPTHGEDGMYILQMRYKGAVFSHETALYLLEMADREPIQYTVTMKRGYNPANLTRQGVKVYTVKKEWYSLGMTQARTPMGIWYASMMRKGHYATCSGETARLKCRTGRTLSGSMLQKGKRIFPG